MSFHHCVWRSNAQTDSVPDRQSSFVQGQAEVWKFCKGPYLFYYLLTGDRKSPVRLFGASKWNLNKYFICIFEFHFDSPFGVGYSFVGDSILVLRHVFGHCGTPAWGFVLVLCQFYFVTQFMLLKCSIWIRSYFISWIRANAWHHWQHQSWKLNQP